MFLPNRSISIPLGKWLGIPERKNLNFTSNAVLEEAFKTNKGNKLKLSGKEFEKLADKTGLEVRQVERCFRKRVILQTPSKLKKFSEASYVFEFITRLVDESFN